MKCIVCSQSAEAKFEKDFREKKVIYFECPKCGHLSASEFDTDELYSENDYFSSVDKGWKKRNERIRRYLRFLNLLPGIKIRKGIPALDFGCGVGKLVTLLNQEGYEAWGYEPFPNQPFNSDQVFTRAERLQRLGDTFQLVTSIEVFEHLRSPDEVMETILSVLQSGGYLLVSTDMYDPSRHGADWYYINPNAGHVSIFTDRSLRTLLNRHGFFPVFRLTTDVWAFRHLPGQTTTADRAYFPLSELRLRLK
ncbi:class I SAM-dependent methyltransferase [Salinibacter ruber]|uniref:class I SAM-dependent methyltransferase n=1 Tax=Salinibacter ruber TaxID=146919 RepID=UPI003C6E8526